MDFEYHSRGFFYIPEWLMEQYLEVNALEDDDEYYAGLDKIYEQSEYVFTVFRHNPTLDFMQECEEFLRMQYQHFEELAKSGENTYYLCYNTEFEGEGKLSQKDQEALKAYLDEGLELVRKGLMLFPEIDIDESDLMDVQLQGSAEDFRATDMEGNPFGPEDLAKYKLTLVNVWYTWCGPCVAEMPDLQKLKESLPEGVNLVTVCLDGKSQQELAQGILAGAGATFQTLMGDELEKSFFSGISAVPTNLFLDKDGKQVGTAVVGAMSMGESFVADSLKIIQERLDLLGQ